MLKPVAVATVFAVPVLALSACSAPEQPATTPGTTPSVWTGSPSPSASPSESGHGQAGQTEPSGEKLTAQLKLADGTTVATADIEFAGGFATVTVETTAPGELTPGFHGLHIHSVGKCEASSVAPTAGAPRPTLGVEWEFALVDAETRDVSNVATEVIEELGENNPHVHKELLRNTVEIVTGVCDSVPEAMDDLRATLATAHTIVRGRGMDLFCAGTHPFAKWSPEILTDAPRYAELIKRTQWWGRQMLIWGVHGHVGISSAHKVMAINTSLLNHYPHLLALSASSPFWDGEDTGYASNRPMMFQQLPTAW